MRILIFFLYKNELRFLVSQNFENVWTDLVNFAFEIFEQVQERFKFEKTLCFLKVAVVKTTIDIDRTVKQGAFVN